MYNANTTLLLVFDYEDTTLSALGIAIGGFLCKTDIRDAFGTAKWVAVYP